MFIAIMVILAIIGLIVAAVFYMREPDDGPRVKSKQLVSSFVIRLRWINKKYPITD